eukprot:m.133243 g.133243  ORF g.133243 m.133243 type:complete len:656 (+) comp15945_c0_seq2:51-2018(+)
MATLKLILGGVVSFLLSAELALGDTLPCGASNDCPVSLLPCANPWTTWVQNFDNVTSFGLNSTQAGASIVCMNVKAWGTTVDDVIWVTRCSPEDLPHELNRRWLLSSNGTLYNPTADLCIGYTHTGTPTINHALVLQPCDVNPITWSLTSNPGQVKTQDGGLCLGVPPTPPAPGPDPLPPAPPAFNAQATISVALEQPVARSGDGFISFNFDWHLSTEEPPKWINMSVQLIDLSNPMLLAAASALAPGHLRIGGSEGDKVVYDVDGDGCAKWSNVTVDPGFCLSMTRWREIVSFSQATGVRLVFGLNGMNRPDDNSPSNFTNIEAFLAYTARTKLPVYGFEFGNELPKVDPVIDGQDFVTLKKLLVHYWPDMSTRPKLIGNDLNPDASYLPKFFNATQGVLDVYTYHDYVGYGLDPKLLTDLIDVTYLDKNWDNAAPLQQAQEAYSPNSEIWVGETAAAWHSGQDNVTNAWIGSFWYFNMMGTLSRHNHTGFCRQTLLGGSYGILRRDNYEPNPDYYVAYLWRHVMGVSVFDVTVVSSGGTVSQGNQTLRTFAHCHRTMAGAVAVAVMNLDRSATYDVTFELESPRRDDYILTAGNLTSRSITLNGQPLQVTTYGQLPPIDSTTASPGTEKKLAIAPTTIAFLVFHNVSNSRCSG